MTSRSSAGSRKASRSQSQTFEIDWLDLNDQELILGRLYTVNVTRKKHERYLTISADQHREDDDGDILPLSAFLTAEETTDPLDLLEQREEEERERARREEEEAILETYSQSIAYIIILWRCDNVRKRAAAYLVIHPGMLRRRMAFAEIALKVQASLFDGIEQIAENFPPLLGRRYATKVERHCEGEQWAWKFEVA